MAGFKNKFQSSLVAAWKKNGFLNILLSSSLSLLFFGRAISFYLKDTITQTHQYFFFIILMPSSGNKHQLQSGAQKGQEEGESDNNSLPKENKKKSSGCQLNVLFVV